jgi:hypothetical protein
VQGAARTTGIDTLMVVSLPDMRSRRPVAVDFALPVEMQRHVGGTITQIRRIRPPKPRNARELSDYKQGDQPGNQATYRGRSIHL